MSQPVGHPIAAQTRNPFPELSSPPSPLSPIRSGYIALDTSTHSTPSSSPTNNHGFNHLHRNHMMRTGSGYDLSPWSRGSVDISTTSLITRSSSGVDIVGPGSRHVGQENNAYRISEPDLIPKEYNDQNHELMFYTDDDNCRPLLVDSAMQACDACISLVEKNHARDDINWVIIEYNMELKQERLVEDHEIIHHIQRHWRNPADYKLSFRKDFRKFEVFRNPSNFIPVDMVEGSQLQDCDVSDLIPVEERYNQILLQHLFTISKLPDIYGYCLLKEKKSWKKICILLKSTGLYYSKGNVKDSKHLVELSSLTDVCIYSVLDPEKSIGSPHPHCLCLRRAQVSDVKDMIFLSMEDEKSFLCWHTTLRLGKYGSRLREDYKEAVNNLEKSVMRDSGALINGEESDSRQRVAMDFTGSRGRVVDDPCEAFAAACEEASLWRKKVIARKVMNVDGDVTRPSFLTNNNVISDQFTKGLGAGVHVIQPWFYSGISRQEAVDLITKHGLIDGVFLVRESHSIAGIHVLSFAHNCKVKHCQIHKYNSDGLLFYSLDGGHTKFTDLIQLVEFYQLNAAGLPTCLTHYVTRLV